MGITIEVRNNNIEKAIRVLKKKLTKDGQMKELKRRQGMGGRIAIFSKYLYIDKLIFDLFKIPFPYMKLTINKKK